MASAIIAVTVIIQILFSAVVVGIAFRSITGKCLGKPPGGFASVVFLAILFALIELYDIPMLNAMDITITIGNEGFAKLVNATPDMPITNLLGFKVGSVVIWVIQAIIGWLAGAWCLKSGDE